MLGKPKVTQAMAKAVCCFMQTDSKVPFLKTTPTSLIEHEGSCTLLTAPYQGRKKAEEHGQDQQSK